MNTLVAIGGKTGKADGAKVLEPIVCSLIDRGFWSSISWSGRAGKGKEKKIALSKYMKVVRAVCILCQKADQQYKKEQCENDIKYKIIKYAYGKNTKNNSDSLQLTDSRTGECYQNHQQYTAPSSSSQNI